VVQANITNYANIMRSITDEYYSRYLSL